MDPTRTPGARSAGALLQQNRGWFTALGVVWIVAGIVAILAPFVAGVAATVVLGAIFVVAGGAQILHAFRERGWSGFAAYLGGGVLALVLGLILLIWPVFGLLSVTLVLAAFFMASGALKLVGAFSERGAGHRGWLAGNGLLGIAIGLIIWLGMPGSALWVVGLLVGIELIITGCVLLRIARGRAALPAPGEPDRAAS